MTLNFFFFIITYYVFKMFKLMTIKRNTPVIITKLLSTIENKTKLLFNATYIYLLKILILYKHKLLFVFFFSFRS